MNLYEIAQRIWRSKLIALGCAVLSLAVALLVGFSISLSPLSIRPRALQLGVAGVQVLVDSPRSSLAQINAPSQGLARVATTYTELMNSPRVIDPIAHAIGVAPQNIGVQEQLTQLVPLSQSQPLEPQVGTQILATRKHYFLDARNDTGSQVISIFTQAPTGALAVKMAAAAANALRVYAASRVRGGRVPADESVVLRELGGPYGRTLNRSASLQFAIIVGILVWILAMIAILTLQTQAWAARGVRRPRELSRA